MNEDQSRSDAKQSGSFRQRLVWSYMAVAGIGLAMLLIVFVVMLQLRSAALRSAELRGPTARTSTLALEGVQRSLAGLRGWIALGDPAFKEERANAWNEDIDPSLARLRELSVQWTNPANQQRLNEATGHLQSLKKTQWWIEDVSQTLGNKPARTLRELNLQPTEDGILASISALIEMEEALGSGNERKYLLGAMANLRSQFARSGVVLSRLVDSDRDVAELDVDIAEFRDALANARQLLDKIVARPRLLTEEQHGPLASIEAELAAYEGLAEDVIAARQAPDWDVARYLMSEEAVPNAREATRLLSEMSQNQDELMRQDALHVRTFSNLAIVISLLSIAGMVLATVYVSRRNTAQLTEPIAAITQATQQLAASSNQIAAASQQQVTSLTESSTSLNQISTTAEQFKTTIQEFVDRSRSVQEAAGETAKQAGDGRRQAQQSAEQTEAVRDSALAAGETVLLFADQMQRITDITDTVNEIAEQTKLLALNASIEAARAGEEGKGFAVVATQVRELANQSKDASRTISMLISDTQRSLQSVVDGIEQGSRRSDETATMVRTMADQFEQMVVAFAQTADAMTQISSGAQQQEQGIVELVTGLTEVEKATRETVAAAEQTQTSIADIDQQITTLNETMEQL